MCALCHTQYDIDKGNLSTFIITLTVRQCDDTGEKSCALRRNCYRANTIMPQKSKTATKERNDFRTSISFSKVIADTAERLMDAQGYNGNLSAYLSNLVRQDDERQLELQKMRFEVEDRLHEKGGQGPSVAEVRAAQAILRLAEKRARAVRGHSVEDAFDQPFYLHGGDTPLRVIQGFQPSPKPAADSSRQ